MKKFSTRSEYNRRLVTEAFQGRSQSEFNNLVEKLDSQCMIYGDMVNVYDFIDKSSKKVSLVSAKEFLEGARHQNRMLNKNRNAYSTFKGVLIKS